MQIFKKEKQVVELALEHAQKTGECLDILPYRRSRTL